VRRALLFDIETVFDPVLARRVVGEPRLSEAEALAAVAPQRSPEQRPFPKPLYHRVVEVAVAVIAVDGSVETLRSLAAGGDERPLLEAFWGGFGRQAGGTRIVTYNGRRFDVPVLLQRALLHGVSPAALWVGDYRQRFHESHLDLMEVLSDYGLTTALSQHEMAVMLGVPGKQGVDGGDVAELWRQGRTEDIAAYCTLDVATLALAFARLGRHAGWCTEAEAHRIEAGIRRTVAERRAFNPLYAAFLDALDEGA
jgi:predicted PolB exonuclease-like 3'-5' exonuclease